MKKLFSKISIFPLAMLIALLYVFAQGVSASLYSPGATLNPNCLPTDSTSTCGVVFPSLAGTILFDNSKNSTYVGYAVGTTSGGGVNNTFVGYQAGTVNPTTSHDTGVGAGVLQHDVSVGYNTAVGDYALNPNTTGSYNTAVGGGAIKSNTTGSENTGLGANVLQNNTTGSGNSAFGDGDSRFSTVASYNSVFGDGAGYSITTGNYNTAFGNNSGQNTTTNNNISIGSGVSPSGNGSFLNIGNTIYGDLSGQKIGIGTTTPAETLDTTGNIFLENASGIIMKDTASSTCYIIHITNGVLVSMAHDCN